MKKKIILLIYVFFISAVFMPVFAQSGDLSFDNPKIINVKPLSETGYTRLKIDKPIQTRLISKQPKVINYSTVIKQFWLLDDIHYESLRADKKDILAKKWPVHQDILSLRVLKQSQLPLVQPLLKINLFNNILKPVRPRRLGKSYLEDKFLSNVPQLQK